MRGAMIGVLFVLSAAPVHAGPPAWLINATCGAAGGFAMAEMVATERCIQRGTCREVNPWMPKGTGPGDALGRTALKSAGTYAGIRVGLHMRQQRPWLALGTCAGLAGFNTWLTVRGLQH